MAQNLSFLVIDDSKMVRDLLQELLLQKDHFDITLAEDGEIALQRVRANANIGKQYDVIICDWEMPARNGHDFLRHASLMVNFRRTALLMVTTVNDKERVKIMLEFGVDEYLLKPFEPGAFHEKLDRALKKKALVPA